LKRFVLAVPIVLAIVFVAAACTTTTPSPSGSAGAVETGTVPPSPSESGATGPADDLATALDRATRYETARAEGRWADAWNLLAPLSQLRIGTLARFAEGETAYNAAGGSIFEVQPPMQDPEKVFLFISAMRDEIEREADVSRGWLVFTLHPDVQSASAGTTTLFVAPLKSGDWRIWIVH
jgi:hypothetical protein